MVCGYPVVMRSISHGKTFHLDHIDVVVELNQVAAFLLARLCRLGSCKKETVMSRVRGQVSALALAR